MLNWCFGITWVIILECIPIIPMSKISIYNQTHTYVYVINCLNLPEILVTHMLFKILSLSRILHSALQQCRSAKPPLNPPSHNTCCFYYLAVNTRTGHSKMLTFNSVRNKGEAIAVRKRQVSNIYLLEKWKFRALGSGSAASSPMKYR